MRRLTALLLIIGLVAGATGLLAGCGGDTKQAQDYVKKGDKLMDEVANQLGQLAAMLSSINTIVTNPTQATATVQQIKEFGAGLTSKGAEAKAEYQKIKSLKGVGDYVKYADLKIEILDDIDKLIAQFDRFLDQLLAMVNSGSATQEQLTSLQDSFQKEISTLTGEISKLGKEANDLKTEKNL
jgi:predicted  nucleic acid-binding Zn-ribbon protein